MSDDLTVKFTPVGMPFIPRDDKNTKPSAPTNSAGGFKKVLDDKGQPKKSVSSATEKSSKQPVEETDEDETSAVASSEEEAAGEKIFSLFSQRKTKVALPKQSSQQDQSEDGDAIVSFKPKVPVNNSEWGEEIAYANQQGLVDEESEVPAAAKPFVKEIPREPGKVAISPEKGEVVKVRLPDASLVVNASSQPPVVIKKEGKTGVAGNTNAQTGSKVDSDSKTPKKPVSDRLDLSVDVEDASNEVDDSLAQASDKASVRKTDVVNPFVREQGDISAVNPQNVGAIVPPVAAPEVVSHVSVADKAPIAPSAGVSALIEQLLKEISVMTVGDKSETTLVLKQPPWLDGAQVVITGFDSARGELNIKFANLTQHAQVVMEQQQQSLLSALQTKGYHVHIFIATTVSEPQIVAASGQPADKDRQQREGGQEQSQDRPKYQG
jgi:hypothetical protein